MEIVVNSSIAEAVLRVMVGLLTLGVATLVIAMMAVHIKVKSYVEKRPMAETLFTYSKMFAILGTFVFMWLLLVVSADFNDFADLLGTLFLLFTCLTAVILSACMVLVLRDGRHFLRSMNAVRSSGKLDVEQDVDEPWR